MEWTVHLDSAVHSVVTAWKSGHKVDSYEAGGIAGSCRYLHQEVFLQGRYVWESGYNM